LNQIGFVITLLELPEGRHSALMFPSIFMAEYAKRPAAAKPKASLDKAETTQQINLAMRDLAFAVSWN
jgi:hypothetical protein